MYFEICRKGKHFRETKELFEREIFVLCFLTTIKDKRIVFYINDIFCIAVLELLLLEMPTSVYFHFGFRVANHSLCHKSAIYGNFLI